MQENAGVKTMRKQSNLYAMVRIGAVCLLGTALFGCGKSTDLEIDRAVYKDSEKDRLAVEEVVKPKSETGSPPNFIVILTDDMGYGDLSCYGSRAIRTPFLDSMAGRGMRFTDFYASSAVCSPSRAGLLTGRYPIRTGVTFPIGATKDTLGRKVMRNLARQLARLGATDMPVQESFARGLPQSEITIAEALKGAGYTSAAIGKWHLGDFTENPDFLPRNHGFDHFLGFNGANDSWPVAFWKNETELVEDIGLDQAHYTRLFTEESVKFIESSRNRPFFLYLAHKDPHQPSIPSEKFERSSKAGPHGDTIMEVDWSVAEIVKALKRNGLTENTLVLFTSDNGPWYDGSPGEHRGRKGQSYEGGYRVPMIAWWPGHIPEGKVCDQPAMNTDFFPTFLELAGLNNPSDRIIDGKSLQNLLLGKTEKGPHKALYFFHDNSIEGLRSDRWKYFRNLSQYVWPVPVDNRNTFVGKQSAKRIYTDKSGKPGVPERAVSLSTLPLLYDLAVDPGENYNVLAHYPEVGIELGETLEAWERRLLGNPRGWISTAETVIRKQRVLTAQKGKGATQ